MNPVHRRTVLRAALVFYAYRFVASALVAYPAARTIAAFGATRRALGDRSLFAPGGLDLIETLRLGRGAIAAAVDGGALSAGVLAVLGLAPLAAGLGILVTRTADSGAIARRAAELFPTFISLGAVTLFVQGALCAVGAVGTTVLSHLSLGLDNERTGDLLILIAIVPTLAAVVTMGVIEDLARATIVVHGSKLFRAVHSAWGTLVTRPVAVLRSYLAVASACVAAVTVSAFATGKLDVSRPGALRFACVFAVHQGALFALAVLRVLWLRASLTFVGWSAVSGDGLSVDLHVAPSGAVPTEIEPHDPAPEGA